MRSHNEEINSPYTADQLYALVADVENYPQFLPWCVAIRVLEKQPDFITADLLMGFKGINESYTSKINLLPSEITIDYLKGPFSHLENNWKFTQLENGTKINFFIKFEFKSKLLEMITGSLFNVACQKMVQAFMKRADELYGQS